MNFALHVAEALFSHAGKTLVSFHKCLVVLAAVYSSNSAIVPFGGFTASVKYCIARPMPVAWNIENIWGYTGIA